MQPNQIAKGQADKPRRGSIPQPLQVAQIDDAMLTVKTACAIGGMSPATFYRLVAADPTFPRLIKRGKRWTRLRAGDWTGWLAAQAAKGGA
jgi:predicted DNA-binding transcriptional regulator AlpA